VKSPEQIEDELQKELQELRMEVALLRADIKLLSVTKLERAISDDLYAIKMVEWGFIGLCALMLTGIITAILGLVVTSGGS
jgi:hypothetical protein